MQGHSGAPTSRLGSTFPVFRISPGRLTLMGKTSLEHAASPKPGT